MSRAYRTEEEYIERILTTPQYCCGDWFRPQVLSQMLCHAGFQTNTVRIADVCNAMVDRGIMEVFEEELDYPGKSIRQKQYRKRNNGRMYLTKAWRKHTNAQLEVSQCCLFPA